MGSTLTVGNVEIMALVDATASAPCSLMFPTLSDEQWAPYEAQLDAHRNIPLTIPSFVLRSGGKTIVVDTGVGAKNRPIFPNGRLPDALADAGIRLEDVDIVLATHIHIDHVGWHTTLRGETYAPTFPNATHVFNRDEYDFFTSPAQVPVWEHVRDCVLPLDGAADIALVDGEHRLTDEIMLLPTPGHTPAHVSVAIMSQGEAAVIIGDVCHHPAQMIECGWSPVFDMNPALAAESREKLMQRIEDDRMIAVGGHFAHPGFGRLVRVDGRRTWQAL